MMFKHWERLRNRWKSRLQEAFLWINEQGFEWLPLRRWLTGYNWKTFRADARAGANVALLDIPQAMAYASLAGLPPQAGIYASAAGSLSGPMTSSSRYVMLGPTNATAVMVLSAFLAMSNIPNREAYIGLLALMVGVMMIVSSLLGAAELVRYVSGSVVTGYMTGAAFLIIANQLHPLLGFSITGSTTLFDVLGNTFLHLREANQPSILIGCLALVLAIGFKRWLPTLPNIALTLLVTCLYLALAKYLSPAWNVVECLAPVPIGHFPLAFPAMTWQAVHDLASPAIAITILATLEGVSISKYLAALSGDTVNANQQTLSKGVSNFCCAFFSAMPCSGSLTRSVLNYKSGALTPISSVISGGICLAAILLGGPLLAYVPKPMLAALIIVVGFGLINRHQIRICLRSTRSDAAVFLVTALATMLFPLDIAVYMGVGVSIALFLRKVSKPELVEYTFNNEGNLVEKEMASKREDPHISIIHVEGELFFGAADLFQEEIRKVSADPNLKVVILRLKNAHHLDATSVMALEQLTRSLRETNRHLIISGAPRDVFKILIDSGLIHTIGRENVFKSQERNPNLSTRRALERARELLGGVHAEVRIFYDPKASPVVLQKNGDDSVYYEI